MVSDSNQNPIITGVTSLNPSAFGEFISTDPLPGSGKSGLTPSSRFKANALFAPSDLGIDVLQQSLTSAGLDSSVIDFVISCTLTPDRCFPGTASSLLAKLDRKGIPGLELKQGAGVLHGIELGDRLVRSGQYRCIAIVATDTLSRFFGGIEHVSELRPEAQTAYRLFGDGSSSCLVLDPVLFKDLAPSIPKLTLDLFNSGVLPELSSAFEAALPWVGQQPVRITPEDVRNQEHLPYIRSDELLHFTKDLLAPLLNELTGSTHCSVGSHQIVGGSNNIIESILEGGALVPDCFNQWGHIGNAGPLTILAEVLEDSKPERIALASTGPGLHWGVVSLTCLNPS